jgi:MYXO-CTERM domain-containing protein
MLRNAVCAACALAGAAGLSFGANIELRLTELSGQTIASPSDSVLDFAVQGRVTGGGGLASWYFDSIQLVGDLESRAVLNRLRISNADGTYYTGVPMILSTIGQGGVASQYAFLPNLSAGFNGLINTSGGPFTNGPDNEIGTPSGFAGGQFLLHTPGVDTDGDGRPDSVPASSNSGALTTSVMQEYFGQGQFVDLYRFRVAFVDLAPRFVTIRLNGALARTFTQVELSVDSGLWGATQNPVGSDTITTSDFVVQVTPTPGAGAVALLGLGLMARRRRSSRG